MFTTPLKSVQPLEVAPSCWMISARNPASLLQCNTYLRQFPDAKEVRTLCIDPGSQCDFPAIEANLATIMGDRSLDALTVNHQDPDVTGNLPRLCEQNPQAAVVMSEDTWRLVQHLQVQPGKLQFPATMHSSVEMSSVTTGWRAVPTPFCHFRGALAFYDSQSRVLFSGDLFGGLNQLGRVHLFAEEADWEGIAQFHRIYMPSREVLRYAIAQIRSLTPAVEVIAPQHGHVIAGDLVQEFMDRMEQLLVGHDLLVMELDEKFPDEYRRLVDLLIASGREFLGEAELVERLASSTPRDGLEACLQPSGEDWRVMQHPYRCATKLFARLADGEPEAFVTELRNRVLHFCSERSVPVPPIGWGI